MSRSPFVVLLAVVLAGCGSGKSASTTTAPSGPAAAAGGGHTLYQGTAWAVVVKDGRGKRRGRCNNGGLLMATRIEMPRFTRTKPYLLHEFAHAIMDESELGAMRRAVTALGLAHLAAST